MKFWVPKYRGSTVRHMAKFSEIEVTFVKILIKAPYPWNPKLSPTSSHKIQYVQWTFQK